MPSTAWMTHGRRRHQEQSSPDSVAASLFRLRNQNFITGNDEKLWQKLLKLYELTVFKCVHIRDETLWVINSKAEK